MIKSFSCKDSFNSEIKLAYLLYSHELFNDSDLGFYETCEELIEAQNDDGSFDIKDETNLFGTAVFTAIMCIASRVFENTDSLFARECIHSGLEAGHFLINHFMGEERIDVKSLSEKESFSISWAFSELIRTDIEIRNAYDHSMMAGMPQKMNRQKKYKLILSMVSGNCNFSDIKDENLYDLYLLICICVLLDDDRNVTGDFRKLLLKSLYNYAEGIDEVKNDSEMNTLKTAVLSLESELRKNAEDADSSGSQLIKVIEYNVMNKKKDKLSEEEVRQKELKIEQYRTKIK